VVFDESVHPGALLQLRSIQVAERPDDAMSRNATHRAVLTGVMLVACASPRGPASASRVQTEGAVADVGQDEGNATAPRDVTSGARTTASETRAPASETNAPTGPLTLPVAGFEPAVVVVPANESSAPLLVATHGAGGDPAWECERWAKVLKSRWFLLCPCGMPLRRGEAGSYYYPDHHALEREVTAAVTAARSTFGPRIATGHGVYVGYSQGATMGALMLVDHGASFPHLLLIEGGGGDWTRARAERFRATGGQSVFMVCGTDACGQRALRARPVLERAGLDAAVELVPGAGHTELGEVGARAQKRLETLIF
jgi:pimeloyl-ACP methyl ester carboxylesterase